MTAYLYFHKHHFVLRHFCSGMRRNQNFEKVIKRLTQSGHHGVRDNMRLQVDLTCLSSQPGLRRADRSVNRIFTLVNLLFSRGALTIFHEMNTSQSDKKQSSCHKLARINEVWIRSQKPVFETAFCDL